MDITLPRIAERLFGEPLMIYPQKLQQVITVLAPRLSGEIKFTGRSRADGQPAPSLGRTEAGRVAVITISGTLTQRSSMMDADSGLLSYEQIEAEFNRALASPSVGGIILDIDSGGGEVAGNFDFVDRIHAARGVKPVWAIANEFAASAAYSIASAAERLYVTRTGVVGSIGVVSAHIDQSGYDQQKGLAWSFIHAGAHKVDGHAHAPLPDEVRADIQFQINEIYDLFVATVARNRALGEQVIRDTEARIYTAKDAMALGLVDGISTLNDLVREMSGMLAGEPSPGAKLYRSHQKEKTMSDNTTNEENTGDSVTGGENPAPAPAAPETAPAPAEDASAKAVAAERARAAGITETAARLNIGADMVKRLIDSGVSLEGAKAQMLDHLAEKSPVNSIKNQAPDNSASLEKLPIEERAKAEWKADAKLHAEFSDEAAYVAYRKAVSEGRAKILGQKTS